MPKAALPPRRILSQADVFRQLGKGIGQDCINAGWIKPRNSRSDKNGDPRLKIYALEDVIECEDRILRGEYPEK